MSSFGNNVNHKPFINNENENNKIRENCIAEDSL